MVWANVMVLGLGSALVLLPVVLHLLMQPKPKVHEFPALKFVKKREFRNRSRLRLRHLLLLLLRCLMILCLAAALAGPSVASREFGQWVTVGGVGVSTVIVLLALVTVCFGSQKPDRLLLSALAVLLAVQLAYGAWATNRLLNSDSAQLIGNSAAPVSALILVDNSCRMEYRIDNQTNLDRAKEFGLWLIGQFPSDSQVCVLATDSEAPFFSVDLGAAKNRIGKLETAYANAAIPDRMAAGLKLLDDSVHERREIYVISDMSQRSWAAAESNLARDLAADPAISLFVVDIGQTEINNFTLAPLTLNSQSIPQNGELAIDASITRIGDAAQRTVRFRLERPDETRPVIRDGTVLLPDRFIERTQTVDIRENSTSSVRFRFAERLPLGVHHGTVEIVGEDSLAIDDVRHLTIEVVENWRVLVVHANNVSPDNLTIALVDDSDQSLFECTVVEQDDMPDDPGKFDAVFLLDPNPGISDTMWDTLRDYVAGGHGLAIFLGANAAEGGVGHPSFQTAAAEAILTGKLNRQWRRPDADLFLSPENLTHPVFAPFRDWETAVPWNRFPVFIHWSIEADARGEEFPTQTVLGFGNSKPALIERQLGQGRIMIMTTPITETENVEGRQAWNWLFSGAPVPAWLLVRQIGLYLVQSQADQLNLNVGQWASLRHNYRSEPDSWRAFTPRTKQSPEKITAADGRLRYRFTLSPGTYRLRGNLDRPALRGFSVNLAPGETDLTRVEPGDVDQILGAGRYQLATQQNEIQRQQGATRRGQEFYPLLLLMLIVLMGLEYLLSSRFYSQGWRTTMKA